MEFLCSQPLQRQLSLIAQLGKALPIPLAFLHKSNFVHRLILSVALIASVCLSFAESTTQITDAKVASVSDHGFILLVGTETLQVEDTGSTKFWRRKAAAKRDDFAANDLVTVRIKTNVDPPELREIADRDSWKWVDNIRKQPVSGTIDKLDSKYLTLKFADGSTFSYRATDKSKVTIKDRPECKLADLPVGMKVFAKGRTLATLDTWLAEITDVPIAAKETKTKGTKTGVKSAGKKPAALPATGKLSGLILSHLSQYKMFDIVSNAIVYHITYTSTTKFTLDGKPSQAASLNRDQKAEISYSRDKFGRIIASKVELIGP